MTSRNENYTVQWLFYELKVSHNNVSSFTTNRARRVTVTLLTKFTDSPEITDKQRG